jgi:hypothetical protein
VENVLYDSFELRDGEFTHLHHPEDFLIIFHSKEALDQMAGDHFINGPCFCLSVRPWCKLAHAGSGHFEYHVDLEIDGIPPQAWHLSTAEHILGASCWIEKLYPATRTCDDLAILRLSGRSHDPQEIKRSFTLEIVELIPAQGTASPPTVRTLTYPISVRIMRAVIDVDALYGDSHDASRGGASRGNDGNNASRGRRKPRRRSRKWRRTGDLPQGRTNGMAMDADASPPWPHRRFRNHLNFDSQSYYDGELGRNGYYQNLIDLHASTPGLPA